MHRSTSGRRATAARARRSRARRHRPRRAWRRRRHAPERLAADQRARDEERGRRTRREVPVDVDQRVDQVRRQDERQRELGSVPPRRSAQQERAALRRAARGRRRRSRSGTGAAGCAARSSRRGTIDRKRRFVRWKVPPPVPASLSPCQPSPGLMPPDGAEVGGARAEPRAAVPDRGAAAERPGLQHADDDDRDEREHAAGDERPPERRRVAWARRAGEGRRGDRAREQHGAEDQARHASESCPTGRRSSRPAGRTRLRRRPRPARPAASSVAALSQRSSVKSRYAVTTSAAVARPPREYVSTSATSQTKASSVPRPALAPERRAAARSRRAARAGSRGRPGRADGRRPGRRSRTPAARPCRAAPRPQPRRAAPQRPSASPRVRPASQSPSVRRAGRRGRGRRSPTSGRAARTTRSTTASHATSPASGASDSQPRGTPRRRAENDDRDRSAPAPSHQSEPSSPPPPKKRASPTSDERCGERQIADHRHLRAKLAPFAARAGC